MTGLGTIAVFMRGEKPSSPQDADEVLVMERLGEGTWQPVERIEFALDLSSGDLGEIRTQMRVLFERLGACRIVVGARMAGLVYQILDRWGFSIFEAGTISDALLDSVLSDVREASQAPEDETPAAPVALDSHGTWFLDLIRLQGSRPDVSSKMALRNFLARGDFTELKLRCSHVPPWFDREFPSLGLSYMAEMGTGEMFVSVTHAGAKKAEELIGGASPKKGGRRRAPRRTEGIR